MASIYDFGGVLERVCFTPERHDDLPSKSLREPFALASDCFRFHPDDISNGLYQRDFVVY